MKFLGFVILFFMFLYFFDEGRKNILKINLFCGNFGKMKKLIIKIVANASP